MGARSIAALNHLPDEEKHAIYARFIPPELLDRFSLPPDYQNLLQSGLLLLKCKPGRTDVVLELRHVDSILIRCQMGHPQNLAYSGEIWMLKLLR
jgi:hypothetical protein